jgi:hypothetical protein
LEIENAEAPKIILAGIYYPAKLQKKATLNRAIFSNIITLAPILSAFVISYADEIKYRIFERLQTTSETAMLGFLIMNL